MSGQRPPPGPWGWGSPLLPPRRRLIRGYRGWDVGWGEAGRSVVSGPVPGGLGGPCRPKGRPSSVTVAPQGKPCPRHPSSAGGVCSPVPQVRDSRSPRKGLWGPSGETEARRRVCRRAVSGQNQRGTPVGVQSAGPASRGQAGIGTLWGGGQHLLSHALALTPPCGQPSRLQCPEEEAGPRGSTCGEQKGGHWAEPAPRGSPRTPHPTPPASPRGPSMFPSAPPEEGVGRWPEAGRSLARRGCPVASLHTHVRTDEGAYGPRNPSPCSSPRRGGGS